MVKVHLMIGVTALVAMITVKEVTEITGMTAVLIHNLFYYQS